MTDFPNGIVLEARKKGLRQSSTKDGEWYDVTFQIHPDDASSELAKMKLGTRVYLVVTEIADDETPKTERPKGGSICKRAVMLCKRPEFQSWAEARSYRLWQIADLKGEDAAAEHIRLACDIDSRSILDHDPEGARIFEAIEQEFYRSQQGRTDEDIAVQARSGP